MTITLIGRDFDLKEKRKHYSVYRIEYFKAHLNVNGLAHGVPLCNDFNLFAEICKQLMFHKV